MDTKEHQAMPSQGALTVMTLSTPALFNRGNQQTEVADIICLLHSEREPTIVQ